jgi:hypothetical protein
MTEILSTMRLANILKSAVILALMVGALFALE